MLTAKLAGAAGTGPSADAGAVEPPAPAGTEPGRAIGLGVRDLDREAARRLRLPRDVEGVLVAHVEPLSPAYDADLQRGHVILEINRQKVRSAADYRAVGRGGPARATSWRSWCYDDRSGPARAAHRPGGMTERDDTMKARILVDRRRAGHSRLAAR